MRHMPWCEKFKGVHTWAEMKSRHHRKKENPGEMLTSPFLTNSLLQKTNPGEIAFKNNKYLFNIILKHNQD